VFDGLRACCLSEPRLPQQHTPAQMAVYVAAALQCWIALAPPAAAAARGPGAPSRAPTAPGRRQALERAGSAPAALQELRRLMAKGFASGAAAGEVVRAVCDWAACAPPADLAPALAQPWGPAAAAAAGDAAPWEAELGARRAVALAVLAALAAELRGAGAERPGSAAGGPPGGGPAPAPGPAPGAPPLQAAVFDWLDARARAAGVGDAGGGERGAQALLVAMAATGLLCPAAHLGLLVARVRARAGRRAACSDQESKGVWRSASAAQVACDRAGRRALAVWLHWQALSRLDLHCCTPLSSMLCTARV